MPANSMYVASHMPLVFLLGLFQMVVLLNAVRMRIGPCSSEEQLDANAVVHPDHLVFNL